MCKYHVQSVCGESDTDFKRDNHCIENETMGESDMDSVCAESGTGSDHKSVCHTNVPKLKGNSNTLCQKCNCRKFTLVPGQASC